MFDCNYLFGLVVYCLVDGAEAASTEFVEQGVLACRITAGNRVGLSWKGVAILARSWWKVSITWFPETVAGGRHGGLRTVVDTWHEPVRVTYTEHGTLHNTCRGDFPSL